MRIAKPAELSQAPREMLLRMKVSPGFGMVLLLALSVITVRLRAAAADFDLSVSNSPNPVMVNQTLTYTINVTNQTGFSLADVLVTNTLPPSVTLLNAIASQGLVSNNGGVITFALGPLPSGGFAEMTVTAQPTTAGFITNTVSVTATASTNITTTNVVTQVITAQSDLGVSITGPAARVLVNDLMTFGLTVTNSGLDAAPNVMLSNGLPAGVKLISVSPASQSYLFTNSSLLFGLGTLTNGGATLLQVTVQPTNAGVLTFSAFVSAAGVLDTNAANDTTSSDISVGAFIPGQLTVTNVTGQRYNQQTGLMEQTIRLSNVGTSAVASARIIVSGLTNALFNAVGTNDGNPFVVYGGTLASNQSVDLVLEYFVPTRLPLVPDPTLTAVEVPAVNLTPPSGTPFNITTVTNLPTGSVLLEFRSVPGRSYTVLYSDNAGFSNALAAQPPILAPADRVQWIDGGPPKTVSRPADAASRFYRVILNP